MRIETLNSLPPDSLLIPYRDAPAYTDGYSLDLPQSVSLADYIAAFYTTPLFKLERLVLALLVARPSTDAQAQALARSAIGKFAAWTVEGRTENQILMCDFMKKTRSWLMCMPVPGATGTRICFGSAIVPHHISADGHVHLGLGFHLLLGFHRLYSRALLQSAARRLSRGMQQAGRLLFS